MLVSEPRSLTIRCLASLGNVYEDWIEEEARVVTPTRPILGVPLTSSSSRLEVVTLLWWLSQAAFSMIIFIK